MEEDQVVLSGLSAVVSSDGERGNNMIREYDAGIKITMRRPLRDLYNKLPRFQVEMQFN